MPPFVLLVSCYELGRQPFNIASPWAQLEAAGFEVAGVDTAVEELEGAPVERADLVAISVPMLIAPADSVNMVGEACATGKPVYVFEPEGGAPKRERFHAALRRHGAIRPLPATFEALETWTYAPLNSSETIAREIARRWTRRTQMLGAARGQ